MRLRSLVLVTVLVVGSRVAAAWGACEPAGVDAADVAAARAAIAAACDCEGAPSHGAYVRCARAAARATLSNKTCAGAVTRCAARSTCGRPGAVACCQTRANGVTRASIKGKASACRAPRGGSACVSPFASACDACTASGCAVPPTSVPTASPTPTPTQTFVPDVCGNGVVEAGEECDAPTCTASLNGQPVQSECGAPGTLHECECRATVCGGCIEFPGTGTLCWASDQCVLTPSGFPGCPDGQCIPTTCQTDSDCSPENAYVCEGGTCCISGFGSPSFCRNPQFELPCCGAAVCGPGSLATCCLPAGEGCTDGATCCSGSCTSGTCE